MKKVIYPLAVLAITFAFVSCSQGDALNFDDTVQSQNLNSDDTNSDDTPDNLKTRAEILGFTDTDAYKAYVAGQCAAGNHENCDILTDGTHQVCPYPDHLGINCNGTYCGGNNHAGQGINCNNPNCTGFVDADGDGKCDNYGTGTNPQNGTGRQHGNHNGGNHHNNGGRH